MGLYFIFSPDFREQGFIVHNGQFSVFPVPGVGGLTGINERGEVTGTYARPDQSSTGPWTGFFATPIRNRGD